MRSGNIQVGKHSGRAAFTYFLPRRYLVFSFLVLSIALLKDSKHSFVKLGCEIHSGRRFPRACSGVCGAGSCGNPGIGASHAALSCCHAEVPGAPSSDSQELLSFLSLADAHLALCHPSRAPRGFSKGPVRRFSFCLKEIYK